MQISLDIPDYSIRPLRPTDAASIASQANDRAIWRNLRDGFPHPYSLADAEAFIAQVGTADKPTHFAIAFDNEAIGAIGLRLREDVDRVAAEIGYWMGRPFWGRGIATSAVTKMTRFALEEFPLTRLEALVFQWNRTSARVLEKAGYRLEANLRKSALKDGRVIDRWLYAFVREEN